MSVFEMSMLLCFGISWPVSICKSWKSRSNGGKSLYFTVLILFGYISGILHKIIYAYDFVLYLYIVNFFMVVVDLILFIRNRKEEKGIKKGVPL